METIRKGSSGKGCRLVIRGFGTREAAHAFLNKQGSNDWAPNSFADYLGHTPLTAHLKPGNTAGPYKE